MVSVSPGSNDGGGASAAPAAVVCCMCGDHGLPGELFRCGLCLQRLQHRYCSDQYPRMAAHPFCNWCLRDNKQLGGGGSPPPPPAAAASKALTTARAKQRASSRLSCASGGGCSRSAFPAAAGPQKPVKKKMPIQKSHERAVLLQRLAATGTAAMGTGPEVQAGARKPPLPPPPFSRAKARVRRYRLLTEVIRCK